MPVSVSQLGVRGHAASTRRMAAAILEAAGLGGRELSVLVTNDAGIRALNDRWRGIDKATDVLSFPMDDARLLGDVAISVERAAEQAEAAGCSGQQETARLLVHGILHLAGYDHARGGRQAARMRAREAELLAAVGAAGKGGRRCPTNPR